MTERKDFTCTFGPIWVDVLKDAPVKMYSFERPAVMFWNEMANALLEKGWTEQQINFWLQSKQTRWALDSEWGDEIRSLATRLAEGMQKP